MPEDRSNISNIPSTLVHLVNRTATSPGPDTSSPLDGNAGVKNDNGQDGNVTLESVVLPDTQTNRNKKKGFC